MKHTLKKILSAKQLCEGIAWKRHHYSANTVIIKKGDIGKTLFFIEKGLLKVEGNVDLVSNQKKSSMGVFNLESGSVFGEMCLHHSQVRMATVTAATDVELLEIDGERLSIYLDDNPIQGYLFYKDLFESMIQRLGVANQHIENLMSWDLGIHDPDFNHDIPS